MNFRRLIKTLAGSAPSMASLRARSLNSHGEDAVREATRLHLGCGSTIMDGWLNADLIATDSVPPGAWRSIRSIYVMDATDAFPFPDDKFEYIYCEDFLEHFDQKDGLSICAECFRVLRAGGIWRFSTPGFDQILPGLNLSDRQNINFGHWNWGHKLLYTKGYALSVLRAVGFDPVIECRFRESDHDELRNVDTREDQKDLNLILEATKPRIGGLTP